MDAIKLKATRGKRGTNTHLGATDGLNIPGSCVDWFAHNDSLPLISLKQIKTPLRYPGGKTRACVKLSEFLPDVSRVKEYREAFLGGGSFAIHITKLYPHLKITVNDKFPQLINLRAPGRRAHQVASLQQRG